MKQRLMIAGLLAFALIAQCISQHTRATQAAAAPIYTVIDLGTLGGSVSFPRGINDSGQIAATGKLNGGPQRAILLTTPLPINCSLLPVRPGRRWVARSRFDGESFKAEL